MASAIRLNICASFRQSAIANLAIAELAFDDAKHMFYFGLHCAVFLVALLLGHRQNPPWQGMRSMPEKAEDDGIIGADKIVGQFRVMGFAPGRFYPVHEASFDIHNGAAAQEKSAIFQIGFNRIKQRLGELVFLQKMAEVQYVWFHNLLVYVIIAFRRLIYGQYTPC